MARKKSRKVSRVKAEDHVTQDPSTSSGGSNSVAPVEGAPAPPSSTTCASAPKNEETPSSSGALPPSQQPKAKSPPRQAAPETNGIAVPVEQQTPPAPKTQEPKSQSNSRTEQSPKPLDSPLEKSTDSSSTSSSAAKSNNNNISSSSNDQSKTASKSGNSAKEAAVVSSKVAEKTETKAQTPVEESSPTSAAEVSAISSSEKKQKKESVDNSETDNAQKEGSPAASEESTEAQPASVQPTLNYKDGHWSPFNQDGVKAYDRLLLLQIKDNNICKRKPDNLPELDVVKNEPISNRGYDRSSTSRMGSMGASDFTPNFMLGGSGGGGRNKGYAPAYRGGNNSLQGRKKPQKIIEAKPSASKSNLKTTENAWVAISKKVENELDDLTTCKNAMTGLLNKLCPDNYDKLKCQFKQLIITYERHLDVLIGLIFEKAISEQHFSPTYAKLCKSVTENNKNEKDERVYKIVNEFKRKLLTKCQSEFERTHKFGGYYTDKAESEKRIKMTTDEEEKKKLQAIHDEKYIDRDALKKAELLESIKNCTDEAKLAELKEELEFQENMTRKRSVGLIKFVGELYKEAMLTPKIMLGLINMFGNVIQDNNAAEALCKLFTTIGERLYNSIEEGGKTVIRDGIEKCRKQAHSDTIDSRTKFLLLDIIELFDNNFVAKHRSQKQVGPSTRAEVYEKAIKEEQDERIAIANSRPSDNRRPGGNRGSMTRENYNSENSEVWKTVINSSNSNKKNSLRNFNARHSDNGGEPTRLGPGGGFSAWSHGASGGARDVPKTNDQRLGNRYNVLQDDDMSGPETSGFRRNQPGGKGFSSLIRPYPFKNSGNDQDMNPNNFYGDRDYRSGDRSNSMNRRHNMPSSGGDGRNKSLNRDRDQPFNSAAQGGNYQPPKKIGGPPNRHVDSAPAPPKEPQPAPINMDDVRRKAIGTVEEYYMNKVLKDAQLDIEEKFLTDEEQMHFIKIVVLDVFEKKAGDREALAALIKFILANKIISLATFKEGMKLSAAELPDLTLDVPQVNDYFISLLESSIVSELFSITDFVAVSKEAGFEKEKLLIKLLKKLSSKSAELLRLWTKSGLKLEDLLGEYVSRRKQTVASFLEEEKLEFLNADDQQQRIQFLAKSFQSKVEQMKNAKSLKQLVRDTVKPFVKTQDGKDKAYVSQDDADALFETMEALKEVMDQHKIEGRETELTVLFAMQSIAVDHKVPSGLLESLFNIAYDADLASKESFDFWENSPEGENEQFQGMCVTSVRSFLRNLASSNSNSNNNASN